MNRLTHFWLAMLSALMMVSAFVYLLLSSVHLDEALFVECVGIALNITLGFYRPPLRVTPMDQ
jgi:hypothetical protein